MPQRLKRLLVVGSIVLAFLGAIYHSYSDELAEQRGLFAARAAFHSTMLERATETALEVANGLRVAAQNALATPGPAASRYAALLGDIPDRGGYGLVGLAPAADADTHLNLTGLGRLPEDPVIRREIDGALALDPMFRWVKGMYPQTPWVYYLSHARFMCVYPYIPFDGFFMDDGFYDMDLFARGEPQNNTDRRPYITDAYVDEAGKGLMVTVGAPVYRGDDFRGIVGFDLTLDSLSESLRMGPLSGESVYLVNDKAQIIASARPMETGTATPPELNRALFAFAREQAPERAVSGFGDAQVYVSHLAGVPWTLIAEKPNWAIARAAAASTVPLVASLLIMLVATAMFLQSRQQQKALESKRSVERFRRLLDASKDMIAVIKPDTGRFLDGNKALCEFLGLTLDDLRSTRVFEVSLQLHSVTEWQDFVKQLGASDGLSIEDRIQTPDGSTRFVEINTQCSKHGDQQYVISVIRDISARKAAEAEKDRLERRLRQTQRIEAIGQVTNGVAHDFNNILASVIGFLELARDRAADDDSLKEYLTLSLKSTGRARQLIRQLMLFSRSDADQTAEPITVAPHIRDIVNMLKPMLSAKIEVQQNLSESALAVRMDPVHLQQLLMNLSINARDAMPDGGTLKIGASERILDDRECQICHQHISGRWACISVTDSGAGIPAELLDRVFEPFFTTRETEDGQGMGLAIVQGIVQTYRGHVLVDSAPGIGTRFDILFEIDAQGPSTPDTGIGRDETLAVDRRRILVVDDEPIIRLYFEEVLSQAKAQVTSCADATEALRIFAEDPQRFDLVITDQTMPGGSGIDLIREVRRLNAEVPVFLHSGYPDAVDRDDIDRYRITRVLVKPSTAEELTAAINAAVGG
jgi:PAS domain S-box-containing protein